MEKTISASDERGYPIRSHVLHPTPQKCGLEQVAEADENIDSRAVDA